jgi:WD40 repeat protein
MADGVWAVQWSAASEWVLISGGCDGAIRFWDIRQAGCFQVLDQNRSQLGRRPPIVKSVPVLGICSPSSVSSRDRQCWPPKYCSLLLSGERNISAEKSTSGSSFCECELQGRILKSAPTRGTATQQAQHNPPHTQEV